MSDKLKSALKNLLILMLFLACVVIVIIGQKHTGWGWYGLQCLGFISILAVILEYNLTHR